MNIKILHFFLLMVIGSSIFHSPLSISDTNHEDNVLSNLKYINSTTPIKSKTFQDSSQQFSKHISTNNPLYKSVISRYRKSAASKQKMSLTDNIISKLAHTPKALWSSEAVNLIVTFNSGHPQIKQTLQSQYNAEILNALPIAFIKTTLSETIKLSELPGITGIYLDQYYQFLDPSWKDLDYNTMTYPSEAYIGARMLLDLGIDGSGIKIAIVDTGIDKTHSDLDDLDNNPATSDPKVIAEQSFIDYDFDGINDTDAKDEFGHGTHCAGIAAANGTLKGVAPGAYLMNARALDASGGAYVSWVVNAINWAVANGADIISMSIGWMAGDVIQLLNEAADAAWDSGSMVVVAAGNSGPMQGTVSSPGMASRAITVGASDIFNITTEWSSRGPSTNGIVDPDVVAPGSNILSTIPGNTYAVYSGTSMATPAVAGVVALLRSAYPSVDIDIIRSAILSTATDIGEDVFQQGAGLINALGAYEYLQNPTNFAYPSFSDKSPLRLSPNERFEYQFDIFVNQSYQSLTIEPSANLAPYVNVSFIDTPTQVGWIRSKVEILMSDTSIHGNLLLKNGTTIIYTTDLYLEPEQLSNDAGTNADAGETLAGAIHIELDTLYNGGMFLGDVQDFYKFGVLEGKNYRVTLTDLTTNFDIIVTDENGTMIAVGSSWHSTSASVNFTAITTGEYYLRIIAQNEGSYVILVEELSATTIMNKVALTENFDSHGVDEDSDGLYDYLALTIEVNTSVAGNYDFLYAICQYRNDYTFPKYIVATDWITISLEEGLSTVELIVPGSTIEQSNYDGSYILSQLLIGDPTTWLILDYQINLFNTTTYNHNQFEAPLNKLTNLSYSEMNLDSTGGPEIFSVLCDFSFNVIGQATISLFIINNAQTDTVAYESVDIFIDAPLTKSIVFNFSGDMFKSYDSIVIAGISVITNDSLFIPIYETHYSSEFANYEPVITYQISDKILDLDNSGLYDTLRLDILVTSKIETKLMVSYLPTLFSLAKERMLPGESDYPTYSIEYISIGDNHIYLDFDLIFASIRKLDGPYLLPFIALLTNDYDISITTHYATQIYDSQTFDKPEAYISDYFGAEKILAEDGGYKLIFEITAKYYLTVEFWVEVESINSYGFYFYTFKDITLSQGKNNVSILIPYDKLFYNKFIGTLKISSVAISLTSGVLDELRDVAVIRDVDYKDFNAFYEAYIIGFEFEYINNDTDPLYEGINVTVQAQINNPGDYEFTIRLDSMLSGTIYLNKILACPSSGEVNVTFFIPASYIVRELSASNGFSILYVEVINTETYWHDNLNEEYTVLHIDEFDYVLPLLYHRFLSVSTFDENNDGLFDGLTVELEWNVTNEDDYRFLFSFSTYPASSDIGLDAFNIEIETFIHYTPGINQYNFKIDSEKFRETKESLDLYGEQEFTIALRTVRVYDSLGDYMLSLNEQLPGTFDITEFDLTPIAEIVDATFSLKDTNDDAKADYLEVSVYVTVNKQIEYIIVELDLYYTYQIGNDYYSYYYYTEEYLSPILGTNKVTFSINLHQLFTEGIPDTFQMSANFYLLSPNYDLIGTYSIPSKTLETNVPIVTTTPTPTDTTPTKKHDFPITVTFAVLSLIALVPLLRRPNKTK